MTKNTAIKSNLVFLTVLIAACSLSPQIDARLSRHWTYNDMFERSDLVVIATVISSNKTDVRTTLPEYTPDLNVIGTITRFATGLILKGPKEVKTFDLFHYAYASEADEDAMSNTPFLLNIKPTQAGTFLLFLSRRNDGSYVPVTGQTDPAFLSVLQLQGGAD